MTHEAIRAHTERGSTRQLPCWKTICILIETTVFILCFICWALINNLNMSGGDLAVFLSQFLHPVNDMFFSGMLTMVLINDGLMRHNIFFNVA